MEPIPAVAKTTADHKGKLLRILGVSFGIAVTLGSTIGMGILRTPGTVAAQLGDVRLILGIWALGGVYALCGTIAVTELATALPQAGGWYVYARRAFGEYAGFTIGWCNWLAFCSVTASITIVLGEYAGKLVPALAGSTKAIAIAALLVFTLLHWLGLRVGSRTQELMGFATALGFVALIAACFIFGRSNAANSAQVTTSVPATASAIFLALVLAFQSVIVTYDGWYGAIYFSEEDEDPARNLPRSLLSAVLVIITIYMLVNLALLYVLPLSTLAASQLAAADAAQMIFGARGGQIITALSFLSLLSVTNACFMETPRIMYGMGRDGLFTARAATVNDKGTPTSALFISALAAIIFVASGTFDKLVAITAFFYIVMYGSGFVALFALRKQSPDLARPFKAWGYPWTTLIVVVLSLVFLVGVLISDTLNSVYALLMLALSYPVYRVVRRAVRVATL